MARRPWPVIAGVASCIVGLCLGAVGGGVGGHGARLAASSVPVVASSAPVGLPAVAANSVPVVAAGSLPVAATPAAEHSQAGAVTAAASAMTVIRGPLLLEPDRYLAAVQAVAEPDVAGALMQAIKPQLPTLAERTRGGAVLRSAPVAWRMVGYAGDEAAVSVCLFSMFGGGIDPHLTVIAELISVRLRWAMTRWLVTGVSSGPVIGPSTAGPPAAGPAAGPPVAGPAVGSAAISYSELAGYQEFQVVPVG